MDHIAILENGLDSLVHYLRWTATDVREKKSGLRVRDIASLLARRKFKMAWARLSRPKQAPPSEFVHWFREQARLDYRLYDYAVSRMEIVETSGSEQADSQPSS